jgi:hypothetical protein
MSYKLLSNKNIGACTGTVKPRGRHISYLQLCDKLSGLRAKTITEARANSRFQITAEEGTGIQEPDTTWEKSALPDVWQKKHS